MLRKIAMSGGISESYSYKRCEGKSKREEKGETAAKILNSILRTLRFN